MEAARSLTAYRALDPRVAAVRFISCFRTAGERALKSRTNTAYLIFHEEESHKKSPTSFRGWGRGEDFSECIPSQVATIDHRLGSTSFSCIPELLKIPTTIDGKEVVDSSPGNVLVRYSPYLTTSPKFDARISITRYGVSFK